VFFELIAPWYDRLMGRPDVVALLMLLQRCRHGAVLDLGGGTGRVAGELDGFGRVLVLDASLGMLRQARAKGLSAVCARAESLPVVEGSKDVVLAIDALHHFSQVGLVLAEARRVLRPGGCLLIEEPDVRSFRVKVIAALERLLGLHSRFYGPGDVHRMVEQAGFQLLAMVEGSTYFRLLAKRP